MKKRTFIKNKRAVSPVVATILLVAIVVVLSVLVYMMAMGINDRQAKPNTGSLSQKWDGEEIKLTISGLSKSFAWDQFILVIRDTGQQNSTGVLYEYLVGITPVNNGTGTPTYALHVEDYSGNKIMNIGDEITISPTSGQRLHMGIWEINLIFIKSSELFATVSVSVYY